MKKNQYKLFGAADAENREPGENPGRTRHCNRGETV
jgi:hypothetical protein